MPKKSSIGPIFDFHPIIGRNLDVCGAEGFAILFYRRCSTISAKELLINDDIRAKEVRLLDSQGDQVGIMSLAEAKAFAYDQGVDLVCIAPQATPPVCRAMDYGKYRYEQDKRVKEQRKKQQCNKSKLFHRYRYSFESV